MRPADLIRPLALAAAAGVLAIALRGALFSGGGRGAGRGPAPIHDGRPTAMPTDDDLKKLPPDGGPDYNRLIFEKSPYLLQHARNPVDWYPWGDEAFDRARLEDKPIFLSIGYSTCHWCHVMEEESFENAAVARLMNDAFVCIKVDREERPDIDNVYMAVSQAMTGGGGWPLTIIMTPDKKPFFAATYIPKDSKYGRVGLVELIPRVLELWTERRSELLDSADKITSALKARAGSGDAREMGEGVLEEAFKGLARRYDPAHGGFGSAPKFPTSQNLLFLLRHWRRTGDERALQMVEHTLVEMRRGGIFDHLGYGFHRYSTDARWLVPHFEKMLYDQAMLATAYVEAYQATGRDEFARTAREVFDYVLRDMTSPGGAFYCAEDADSEGEEGKYYIWTKSEIMGVLGPDEGELFSGVFGVDEEGDLPGEGGGPAGPENILHVARPMGEAAAEAGLSGTELRSRLESDRLKLLEERRRRIPPHKDDKILADWNGLMIAALAKGARALGEPRYGASAAKAADFVLDRMRDDRGGLLHRFRGGSAGIPAFLDDYAFFVWGLIELYEASFDQVYLQGAIDLADRMTGDFWDQDTGGFFFQADGAENLLIRSKEAYEGAMPSGNSVAALDLLRLGHAAERVDFDGKANGIFRAFSAEVSRAPFAYTYMMAALDFAVGPSYEVVIAGDPATVDDDAMVRALRTAYVPDKVVLFRPAGETAPPITRIAKFTRYQTALDGRTTAYVCMNYSCKEPTTDPSQMLKLLEAR